MSQLLESYLLDKEAEVTGTHAAPISPPTHRDRDRNPAKTIKTGSVIDTTGLEPPVVTRTKTAQHYALPSHQRYPLDSYNEVKTAAAYYDENRVLMAPELRREYCYNLTKRASQLGIRVTPEVQKYGADGYAPEPEFEIAMAGRRTLLKEAAAEGVFNLLLDAKQGLEPEEFALALGEFDKYAGIDPYYGDAVFDPYYSTFGAKTAEEEGSTVVGNDYLSHSELVQFAATQSACLKDVFGEDFVDEFRKEPVSIFKSLPVDQKKIVMRRVNSYFADPTPT